MADGDRAAGRVRRDRDRVLGAARLPDLPRLRELRRLADRRRDRGRDRRPAGGDRPAAPDDGRAPTSPASSSATPAGSSSVEWEQMEDGTLDDQLNPWGPAMFRTLRRGGPRDTGRAVELRPVARADVDPPAGPAGPDPRRRRGDADAAVDRAVLHLADRARLHPHLRRQRGAGGRAGALHGRHRRHDPRHAAAAAASSTIPSSSGVGGLQPTAMERTLVLIDEALDAVGIDVVAPCDDGRAPEP